MKTLKLLSIASIFLLNHCNKAAPPLPTYTVKGAIINGTTGQPLDIGQSVQLEVLTQLQYGNIQSAILGNCVIDSYGRFNFTYTQTNITDRGAYLRIDIQVGHFGNFAVNQNINQNIYISSMGTVKIYLSPLTPLALKDTLYLGYGYSSTSYTDTIFKTFSGYYKTIHIPMPYVDIIWGRGWNKYDSTRFTSQNRDYIQMKGDPFVDSVTINY